jgi:glycosyltransferase involved in cell wall biosynthesis
VRLSTSSSSSLRFRLLNVPPLPGRHSAIAVGCRIRNSTHPGLHEVSRVRISKLSSVISPTPVTGLNGASKHRESLEMRFQGGVQTTSVRRVVHLSKHCVDGNGHVHVAVDLACLQADAGCEVLFVSGGGTYEPMLGEHRVRHIKLEQDPKNPLSLLKTIWKLFRVVRSFRPQVLHAHMMGGAIVGYPVSLVSRVPLITTVHNSFNAHSIIMRLGRRVVAVSNAEKEKLVRRGFDARRMDVVLNAPVGSPRAQARKNAVDPVLVSPCITTVCGLHRRKGVFDLLEACSVLFREMPEWRLYIAGDGPDRKALERQAIASGVGDKIIFMGAVPAPRVLFEQTDIFTLCSYADPCSLVIGEARGAGCAIVATAVGGTPEMLEFGRAGRLVPPGQPTQLASELRKLMTDRAARASLRRASIEGAEIFNVHRLLGDYDEVYQRALARR